MNDCSLSPQKESYELLIGFIPEAIVLIFGGMIKVTSKDGTVKYRSTGVDEGDAFGVLWGEARVLAVAELAERFPEAILIITGVSAETGPWIVEELKQLGVSPDRIILEDRSTDTLSQIGAVLGIVWEKGLKHVVFVTSEYHVPRTRALFENFEQLVTPNAQMKHTVSEFKSSGARWVFLAAEDILPQRDKKYVETIAGFKKSPAYLKRLKNEKRGLMMIKNGEYGKMRTNNADKSERSM